MQVFTVEDALEVAKLEVGVLWKWSWLKLDSICEYQDREYVFPLSRFFSKIDKPGFAKCN